MRPRSPLARLVPLVLLSSDPFSRRLPLYSTFLPQDRVASFAMMTPPELLRETQHAAGNENLTKWHQVLIAEYKHLKESQIVRRPLSLTSPASP